MKRFWLNLFACLLIISLCVWYLIIRPSETYKTYWIFHFDGAIQSLFASILFLILVFILVKPSITIAEYIAELPPNDLNNSKHLRIKIVNNSLFKAYDFNVYIYKVKRISISGSDVTSECLATYNGTLDGCPYLHSALSSFFKDTKQNAAQIKMKSLKISDEDIKHILADSQSYIEIHVSIRHGLSGLQGLFVKQYPNSNCIKEGFYFHGFNSEIRSAK